MTYDEFKACFTEKLLTRSDWKINERKTKFYPNGYTSLDQEELRFIRETNLRYHKTEADTLIGDYLTVSDIFDTNAFCRFSFEYLYDLYQSDGWDQVWKDVKENFELCSKMYKSGVLEHLENYEVVKDKLIIRPLNYNDNRFELKNTLYKRVGDIALVLYMTLCDEVTNTGKSLFSFKVYKEHYKLWGLSEEEIWQAALANTNIVSPPRIYLKPEELINPAYTDGAFMAMGNNMLIDKNRVATLTTTSQLNGAIAYFYPGVKERIAQMIGGSYYVVFGSTDQAYIHYKDTNKPINLLSMLKQVNKEYNHPSEILTRKIYYYDANNNDFTALEL